MKKYILTDRCRYTYSACFFKWSRVEKFILISLKNTIWKTAYTKQLNPREPSGTTYAQCYVNGLFFTLQRKYRSAYIYTEELDIISTPVLSSLLYWPSKFRWKNFVVSQQQKLLGRHVITFGNQGKIYCFHYYERKEPQIHQKKLYRAYKEIPGRGVVWNCIIGSFVIVVLWYYNIIITFKRNMKLDILFL